MYARRILAIVCSGALTAGMGSAFAMEDAAPHSDQGSSSGSNASTSQTTQSQTWPDSGDAKGNDMSKRDDTSQNETTADQTGTTAQDEAMAQGGQAQSDRRQASGTDMSGEVVRNRQGERIGRVAGALVDPSGRITGYIVRTGEASGSGEKLYVVVPRDGAQTAPRQLSGTGSMTQPGATSEGTRSTSDNQTPTAQRRMLLNWMYQQLQKQALEIRLLKQQLARQQFSGMSSDSGDMLKGMGSGNGPVRSAQNNPLGQVAQVVVDRFGRVQAVVLESGIVLAPAQAGAAQGQANP